MNSLKSLLRSSEQLGFALFILLHLLFLSTTISAQRNVPSLNYELQQGTYLNTVTLGVFHEREDFRLPGLGGGLDFTFYYNSTNDDRQYGFGEGWSFTYNFIYELDESGPDPIFSLHRGDGSVDEYEFTNSAWHAPVGVFDTLVEYTTDKYRITDKFGNQLYFDDAGHRRLSRLEDRNGNTTTIGYSTNDLPVTITDASGRVVLFNYTDSLLEELRIDFVAPPIVVRYEYDGLERLVKVTDTEGNDTQYEYDDEEGLSGIGGPGGGGMLMLMKKGGKTKKAENEKNNHEIEEDPDKKLLKIVEGITLKREIVFEKDTCQRIVKVKRGCCGGERSLEYDPNNNVVKQTDASGNLSAHSYDGMGNRLMTIHPSGATETWTYEPVFNLPTSYTGPNGNTVSYTYDANGNRVTETYPTHGISRTYDGAGNVLAHTDGNGGITTYTYDANGYPTSRTDALGNTTTFVPDAVGNITSVTDPLGNTILYSHDTKGRITRFTDAEGNTSLFTYDARGNQTTITDPQANVTTIEYDNFDRRIRQISPSGITEEWTYNEYDQQTSYRDGNGNLTTNSYDGTGNLLRETDALDYQMEFTYDDRGNVTSQTQPNGSTIIYAYDNMNRQISSTDALGQISTNTYDAAGNILSATDAAGHTTTYAYDAVNRVSSITDPLGNTTNYSYDANGNLVSLTDRKGQVTTLTYDGLNRLVSRTNPLGHTTTYGYNAAGYQTTITNALGHVHTLDYNARGLPVTETDAEGEVTTSFYDVNGILTGILLPNGRQINILRDQDYRPTSMNDQSGTMATYTYDSNGNLLTETNGLGNTVLTVEYDALDRVIRETDNAGLSASYQYDALGNLERATNREGRELRSVFDPLGRRTEAVNFDGSKIVYDYDAVGNRTLEVDENGSSTSYDYDPLDRLVRVTFADGATRITTYDANGNPTSETNRAGNTTNYVYDAADRLVLADRPGANDDSYTYNAIDQIIAAANPVGALTFTYDRVGRTLTETLNGKVTSYAYDDAANEMTIIYPGGRSLTQTLDPRGNLVKVSEGATVLHTYAYDAADRRVTAMNINGTSAVWDYDALSRVTGITHSSGIEIIAGFDFGYSSTGQLTAKDFLHREEDSERLQYDINERLYRVVKGSVVNDGIPNPNSREAFAYDGPGNRIADEQDGAVRGWSVNGLNQYTEVSVPEAGTATLHYDANGNLTDDGNNTYLFDENNRMMSSAADGVVANYNYDPLGRRIIREVDGVETRFYYDGIRVIEERDVADVVTATYVYGTGPDEILSMRLGGDDFVHHQSLNGTVVALTDNSGAVVERYGYDAYGAPRFFAGDYTGLTASAVGNPYLFSGRRYDEHSGLYYHRERYYQPDMGRFLSHDPLGTLDDANLYAFVGNDPVNATDPLGNIRAIYNWTPTRQPIKWEEIGLDTKRGKSTTITKYFKRQCCCIEASYDQFDLTTTTRFRGYEKYVKTNPRWWDLYLKLRRHTLGLQYDLENITELIENLKDGNNQAFGLKSNIQDALSLLAEAGGTPAGGTLSKIATGELPDLKTIGTDAVGFGIGKGTTAAATNGFVSTTLTASRAGGYAGLAFAAGFAIGTKLNQAWVLSGLSSEIEEKVKKAEKRALLIKKLSRELGGTEAFLRRYEERIKSESRTDPQRENFRAKQVPLSKCKGS